MMPTHTRTHVFIDFADPNLRCDKCKGRVPRWHDDDRCGCAAGFWNEPCGCRSTGVTSDCPSWSPVDGCSCPLVSTSDPETPDKPHAD